MAFIWQGYSEFQGHWSLQDTEGQMNTQKNICILWMQQIDPDTAGTHTSAQLKINNESSPWKTLYKWRSRKLFIPFCLRFYYELKKFQGKNMNIKLMKCQCRPFDQHPYGDLQPYDTFPPVLSFRSSRCSSVSLCLSAEPVLSAGHFLVTEEASPRLTERRVHDRVFKSQWRAAPQIEKHFARPSFSP